VPLVPDMSPGSRARRFAQALARLKGGVTVEQAQAEMDTIARRLAQAYPITNAGWGIRVIRLRDDMNQKFSKGLIVFSAPVFFVLLIACANTASLLLARAARRNREMAVRAAMGAGRFRLVRQLLTESVPLALLGGSFGLLVNFWGMVLVRKLFADILPLAALRMDARLLAFALLLSMLTPFFFGLAPAICGSKLDVNETLKGAENVGRASRGSHRLREWLVVTEMMLAVALLGVCGLFIDIWVTEARVKPGFDPRNMLTATLSAPESAYSRPEDVRRFYRRLLERIDAIPGVERAAYGNDPPLFITTGRPLLVDRGPAHPTQASAAEVRVSPGFIEAVRIPLLRGRTLTEQDSSGTLAVVSDDLARRAWLGGGAGTVKETVGGGLEYQLSVRGRRTAGVLVEPTGAPDAVELSGASRNWCRRLARRATAASLRGRPQGLGRPEAKRHTHSAGPWQRHPELLCCQHARSPISV